MQTGGADEFLIEQIRDGDQGAWRRLIERYQGRLLAFARSRTARCSDAEDLVQEAFVGFARANAVPVNYVLTRNHAGRTEFGGTTVNVEPVSRFCYRIGREIADFSSAAGADRA